MNSDLLKLLNLSQENNDRLVIYNPENPEKSWVAVSLKDYQSLINKEETVDKSSQKGELTSDNFGDKINPVNEDDKIEKELENKEETKDSDSDEDKFSEDDLNDLAGKREVYKDPSMPTSVKDVLESKKGKWNIPGQVKNSATEVIE